MESHTGCLWPLRPPPQGGSAPAPSPRKPSHPSPLPLCAAPSPLAPWGGPPSPSVLDAEAWQAVKGVLRALQGEVAQGEPLGTAASATAPRSSALQALCSSRVPRRAAPSRPPGLEPLGSPTPNPPHLLTYTTPPPPRRGSWTSTPPTSWPAHHPGVLPLPTHARPDRDQAHPRNNNLQHHVALGTPHSFQDSVCPCAQAAPRYPAWTISSYPASALMGCSCSPASYPSAPSHQGDHSPEGEGHAPCAHQSPLCCCGLCFLMAHFPSQADQRLARAQGLLRCSVWV